MIPILGGLLGGIMAAVIMGNWQLIKIVDLLEKQAEDDEPA